VVKVFEIITERELSRPSGNAPAPISTAAPAASAPK